MANSTIGGVANNQGAFSDVTVWNNKRSHVIIDLIDYFAKPERTTLDSQTVTTSQAHTASFTFTSPACPTGYTFSGAGHDWGNGSTDV